jgi:hypothetical protein
MIKQKLEQDYPIEGPDDIDITIYAPNHTLNLLPAIEYLKTKNVTYEIVKDLKKIDESTGHFICYFDKPLKFRDYSIYLAWTRLISQNYDHLIIECEDDQKKYKLYTFMSKRILKAGGLRVIEDKHSLFFE